MTQSSLSIPVSLVDGNQIVPEYAYPGDAGTDLRSTKDMVIMPFERALVPCGISLAIPEGYAGLVVPRSGLAIKHGISVVNAPGLIDSNYRGEIMAILINMDKERPFEIKAGDRIAQLVVVKVKTVEYCLCSELPDSSRGEGGFGSSGIS